MLSLSVSSVVGGGGGFVMRMELAKVLHRSNQMYELKHFGMVWQRRTGRKCCGAQRKPISSPFEKFAKGLEKYRK
jgi:hypothetical protein